MTLIDCYNLEIGWRMVGGPGLYDSNALLFSFECRMD